MSFDKAEDNTYWYLYAVSQELGTLLHTRNKQCYRGLNESYVKKFNAKLHKFQLLLIRKFLYGIFLEGLLLIYNIDAFNFPSAGDSYTQFRFAEEKEWDTENICPKQVTQESIVFL